MTICTIGSPPFDKETLAAWQNLRDEFRTIQERVELIPIDLVYESDQLGLDCSIDYKDGLT